MHGADEPVSAAHNERINMDPEEERVLYLTRVGRDKIFKYGTYTMTQERAITQDHPFYAKREDAPGNAAGADQMSAAGYGVPESEAAASAPPPPPVPEEPPSDEDAAELAAQMISSNFKVGLSQEEVDALLNGI